MKAPLVSIILPTFNGAAYLEQAVRSITDQCFSNWELIIVDDCSTDGTPNIIAQFIKVDERIRTVRNQRNLGLPESLNVGFGLAKGRFLTWTSDDNRYKPEALQRLVSYLQTHPEIDLVYSDYEIIDENGILLSRVVTGSPEDIAYGNVVNASFLFTRKLWETLGGFDPKYRLAEDFEFNLRAAQNCRFGVLHESLYEYRTHRKSLAKSRYDEVRRITIRLLHDNLGKDCWDEKAKSLIYLRLARETAVLNDRRQAIKYLIKSLLLSKPVLFDKRFAAALYYIVVGNSGSG